MKVIMLLGKLIVESGHKKSKILTLVIFITPWKKSKIYISNNRNSNKTKTPEIYFKNLRNVSPLVFCHHPYIHTLRSVAGNRKIELSLVSSLFFNLQMPFLLIQYLHHHGEPFF